jgi:hypothetical protein
LDAAAALVPFGSLFPNMPFTRAMIGSTVHLANHGVKLTLSNNLKGKKALVMA